MNKKIIKRYLIPTLTILLLAWIALTLYVESTGPSKQWVLGNESYKNVLIIYDPDPFYNLDEKVCMSLGKAIAEHNVRVKIASVAAAENFKDQTYDALIYCANTYNWRPDWSITKYIKHYHKAQNHAPVVAITLGAGSTQSSQASFEKIIIDSGGNLIASYSLWLWRPNDESKNEPNVKVAESMAYGWGNQIAEQLN